MSIQPKSHKTSNRHEVIILKDKYDLENKLQIKNQLFELYNEKDLGLDYKENSSDIQDRILNQSKTPETFLIACVSNKNKDVDGGCIVEFYDRSSTLLITYLFVRFSKRQKGIAKEIINTGIREIIKGIEANNKSVAYVFLEAKNPFKISDPNLKVEAAERLLIFKSLRAKWIDLEYIHPPLLIKNHIFEKIEDLLLLTIPELTLKNFFLDVKILNIFLIEYYFHLGAIEGNLDDIIFSIDIDNKLQEAVIKKQELKQMLNEINQKKYYEGKKMYLKEIPRFERPRIEFGKTSICFEFLIDESQSNVFKIDFSGNIEEKHKHNPDNNYNYCNFFHSYETDLFSFHFQENPPYYTKAWESISATKIAIYIPIISEFISEGRKEMLYSFDESESKGYKILPARAFVNYTYFRESKIRVWHLIISSDLKHPFTELDIIKLLKIFNGAQEQDNDEKREKNKYIKGIKFKIEHQDKFYTISNLISGLTGVSYISKHLTRREIFDFPTTGIIEIDTENSNFIDYVKESKSDNESFNKLYSLIANANKLDERIDYYSISPSSQGEFFEYICGALCGISLGILDYKRMGYEEVMDTLIPRSETETSFISLNRGLLCLIGSGDSVLESSWNTLGMSPYLIIPSAVLAHNQYLIDKADSEIQQALERVKNFSSSEILLFEQIKQTKDSYSKVNELINILFLKNIFQYPTEKDLYDYGSEHRRILEKVKIVESKMEQLTNHAESIDRVRSDITEEKNKNILITQYFVTIFLGFISAISLHPIFNDFLSRTQKHLLPLIDIFAFVILSIIAFTFYSKISSNLTKH